MFLQIVLSTLMVAITECDSTYYGEMKWDGNTIVAANGLLKMFQSFIFILSFVFTMDTLAIINPDSIHITVHTIK